MAGPWEKYAQPEDPPAVAATEGPWERYQPQKRGVVDQLLGLTGERYQLAPERMARAIGSSFVSGVTAPGRAMQGEFGPPGSREFTQNSVAPALDTAAIASPMNPAARAGDMVIPGMKMAPKVKTTPPTTQELRDEASGGYKAAAEIPLDVKGEAVQNLARNLQADLEKQGFREQFAPGTHSILKDLQNPPPGAIASGPDLEAIRQSINVAARAMDPREAAAAGRVVGGFDRWRGAIPEADVLAGSAPASSAAYRDASGNYAASARSNKITGELDNAYTGVVDRAELGAAAANSGQNVGNSIRQRAKSLLQSRKDLRGFSGEEIAGLEGLVKGTPASNTTRYIGNLLGGGGGLGQALTTAGGAAAGAGAGGPVGAAIGGVVAPLVGVTSRAIANQLTQRQAKALDELVRSRSPLYEKMSASAPRDASIAQKQAALLQAIMLEANQQ